MAESRDNSVLFSLKELRRIEDDRVKQEQDAERRRLEAEQCAKEDAERRAREEAERKAREEQDRQHRLQAEKDRQLREEQNRLETEKHRVQIDAATRLEEVRLHAEAQAKAAEARKKQPVKIILGVIAAVLAVSGGALGYVFGVVVPRQRAEQDRSYQEQLARHERVNAAKLEQAIADAKAQMDKDFEEAIAKAQSVEAKAELIRQREEKKVIYERVMREKAAADAAARAAREQKKRTGLKKCKDQNDPLCGVDL